MKRTLLIDADIIAYKASSSTESGWDFESDEGSGVVIHDFEAARVKAHDAMEELRKTLVADELIVCLSDPIQNFRKALDPTYKAQRVKTAKPVNLLPIKGWLADNYKSFRKPALEGDDVAGILTTHPLLFAGTKIIVSDDKDMRQIPGKLYVPRTGERLVISPLEADRFHMKQTLTGDPTDNYPGCPRVGPKSPYVAALADCESPHAMWQLVLDAYALAAEKGRLATIRQPYEHALLQARLARILRYADWDGAKQAPRLWEPPAN